MDKENKDTLNFVYRVFEVIVLTIFGLMMYTAALISVIDTDNISRWIAFILFNIIMVIWLVVILESKFTIINYFRYK